MSSALRRALAVLLVVSVLPLTSSCVYDKTRMTPTSIERWAEEIFAPVYAASAPRAVAEEARGHA